MGTKTSNAKTYRMKTGKKRSYPSMGPDSPGRDYSTMPGKNSKANNGGGSDSRNAGRSSSRTYTDKYSG